MPFPRQGRSIRCQGQLEAAAAQILVASPVVESLEEQPLSIWYAWDDDGAIQLLDGRPVKKPQPPRRSSYVVPDFLVRLRSGAQHLIEVKPSRKLARSDVLRKLSVARQFALQKGWAFHVVTERELFAGAILKNVRLLNRFRCLSLPVTEVRRIQELVVGQPRSLLELAIVISADIPLLAAKSWLLHLAAIGGLALDPRHAPIADHTLLFSRGSIPWDPFDSVWGPNGSSKAELSVSSAKSVPNSSSPRI